MDGETFKVLNRSIPLQQNPAVQHPAPGLGEVSWHLRSQPRRLCSLVPTAAASRGEGIPAAPGRCAGGVSRQPPRTQEAPAAPPASGGTAPGRATPGPLGGCVGAGAAAGARLSPPAVPQGRARETGEGGLEGGGCVWGGRPAAGPSLTSSTSISL